MNTSYKTNKKLLKDDLDKIKKIINQYKNTSQQEKVEEWVDIDERT